MRIVTLRVRGIGQNIDHAVGVDEHLSYVILVSADALQMKYFIGALYLFFINSVFIAMAAFIMVKEQ